MRERREKRASLPTVALVWLTECGDQHGVLHMDPIGVCGDRHRSSGKRIASLFPRLGAVLSVTMAFAGMRQIFWPAEGFWPPFTPLPLEANVDI